MLTRTVESAEGYREEYHSARVVYQDNTIQIKRVISTTISIGKDKISSVEEKVVDADALESDSSLKELYQMGKDCIGQIVESDYDNNTEAISGQTYTTSACMNKKGNILAIIG